MSSVAQRTPRSGRQSLFFQDLASPISARRGKFSSPGHAGAASSLWRESISVSDLPPPPIYTLEDRSDISPESGIPDYHISPETKSDPRSPIQTVNREFSSPAKSKSEASTSYALKGVQQNQQSSPGLSWWSPTSANSAGEQDEKGRSSPVEGVVQSGALVTVPSPREVAMTGVQQNSLPAGNHNEEEWITVYGFPPEYTNLVLREFEKCGRILKHVPGPRDSNWIHILYQNRADAQRAVNKNGMQINGALIVGVKSLDPLQRQALNQRLTNQGFMPLPPPSARSIEGNTFRSPYLQNGNSGARHTGAIASPAKSMVSKIMDLMFGV